MTRGRGPDGPGSLRKAAALAAIALLTVSTACTSRGDPPEPTVYTTVPALETTPAPTPTATSPQAPAGVAPTAKSAKAFVRYFWDVYNYSYAVLDATLLESISMERCKFCKSTRQEIARLRRGGLSAQGGEIVVRSVVAPPGDLSRGVIVTLVIDQAPGRTLNRDGSTSSTFESIRNMRSEVALRWTGASWRVYGVANDEKSGTP